MASMQSVCLLVILEESVQGRMKHYTFIDSQRLFVRHWDYKLRTFYYTSLSFHGIH